ncbi:MAG: anhydro-N-acetylmuramic acid kinase, partial [Myxococcota bacterium]
VIGLMSGTSADAVDAALVDWPDGPGIRPHRLLAYVELPLSPELRERIHGLGTGEAGSPEPLRELVALDVELADCFALAAARVAAEAGIDLREVDAVASHGQTLAHHPEVGGSLQVGDPSRIAERTGCLTVADFRARDLALGGDGAPLAPFFHHALFTHPEQARVVLNLGGIANLTWLPPGARPEEVVAFDVGPANALIDAVVALASGGREQMDRDGARAARGRVDEVLLAQLMDDAFLSRPPPKSTGRERYGGRQAVHLHAAWRDQGGDEDDLLATLVAFTAAAVAHAVRVHLPAAPPDLRLLVGGGGARNPALMAALAGALDAVQVASFDSAGVPADAAEAMAFSLMGRNALLGLPNHLPQCTGARRAGVLGEFVPGGPGQRLFGPAGSSGG